METADEGAPVVVFGNLSEVGQHWLVRSVTRGLLLFDYFENEAALSVFELDHVKIDSPAYVIFLKIRWPLLMWCRFRTFICSRFIRIILEWVQLLCKQREVVRICREESKDVVPRTTKTCWKTEDIYKNVPHVGRSICCDPTVIPVVVRKTHASDVSPHWSL